MGWSNGGWQSENQGWYKVASAAVATADIYVIAGQSNATGHFTTLAGVPSHIVADSGVQLWDYDNSQFVQYSAGVNSIQPASGNNAPTTDCWGPEAEFSYRLRQADPTKTIYLVKYAIGSTQLFDDGTSFSWSPSVSGTTRGLFTRTQNAIIAAKAAITALGLTPKVRGIVFMQGEADALSGGAQDAAYPTNLAALLTAMRTSWGDASTRIVLGRVNPVWGGVGTQTRLAEEVQMNSDALGSWVNTDTYHLTSSHFDNTSQPIFGGDCYDALTHKYVDFVVNGSFASGITSWSAVSSPDGGGTFPTDLSVISFSSGALVVTSGVNKELPTAVQTISGLTVGKQYWFQGKLAASSINARLNVADDVTGQGGNFGQGTTMFVSSGTTGTPGTYEGSFVATQTSVTIGLENFSFNTSGSNTFDDIRLIGPNWS